MTSLTVCIANHNYGAYVGQAIESSLDQSHLDIEIIVVDDGSTDNSLETLRQFGTRITVLPQENAGQFASVRRAFESSSGSLIIFLDADDLLDHDTGERVVKAFERFPRAARVQWRLRVIGPNGEPTNDTFPPRNWDLPQGDLRNHVLRRRTYVWPPTSGNAYPREVLDLIFEEVGSRKPLIDLVLAETTPLIGPIVNLHGIGGSYRWHNDNFSAKARRDLDRYLHDRIDETIAGHEVVRSISSRLGIADCPPDARTALDWAFAGYRLGSIKLDRRSHPIDDRVLSVAAHGIRAVLTQPDYRWMARLKRAAWFLAVSGAPRPLARRLVERAFLRPPTAPRFTTESGQS